MELIKPQTNMVKFLYEKAFRDLGYRIMWDKLDTGLEHFGIKQSFSGYDRR